MSALNCLPLCIDRDDCQQVTSPGWSKFWIIPLKEIRRLRYEQVNGDPRARVIGIDFETGISPNVATLESEKRIVGAQFDFDKGDNGQDYEHTIQLVFNWRNTELRTAIERLNNTSEYMIIGLSRSGDYWLVDSLVEGFTMTADAGENGRISGDNATRTVTFNVGTRTAPKELLVLDSAIPDATYEQRLEATGQFLDGITSCQDNCACVLVTNGVMSPFTEAPSFVTAIGGTETRNAEIEFSPNVDALCTTDDLQLVVLNAPAGLTIDNAVFTDGTPNTLAYDVTADTDITVGSYSIELQIVGGVGCNPSFVQNVEITAA